MIRFFTIMSLLATAVCSNAFAATDTVQGADFEAVLGLEGVTQFKDASGEMIIGEGLQPGLGIHCVDGAHMAQSMEETIPWKEGDAGGINASGFDGLDGGNLTMVYGVDTLNGGLKLRPQAKTTQPGVSGVSWSTGIIPFSYNILAPGNSGQKFTKDCSLPSTDYDYPMGWEAQMVIIEGDGKGLLIWAEDDQACFKRLSVIREAKGWRLVFRMINQAPFDTLTGCKSIIWHMKPYTGDWRAAAKIYRDWSDAHLKPVKVEDQGPSWVKDIRAVVVMQLDPAGLDWLDGKVDPAQTMVYAPEWRAAGYDRNYPEYDAAKPELAPFVQKAKAMGFRVMLHVNYFGCDPLNPVFPQFEPYQVKDCLGAHDKLWWVWPVDNPDIRFAYINPAYKPWRDLFVARMKQLCETFPIDALHLDQTWCVYNDNNGLIDGMTMAQGNIAQLKALREALPDIALSGENLNEVTFLHQAFSQRMVPNVNNTGGSFDRLAIEASHPISSYLLRPYTIMFGHLGFPAPGAGQSRSAWNEAYRRWGVIPSVTLYGRDTQEPLNVFMRQYLEDVKLWQTARVSIDMDGAWPEDVAFPSRAADGTPVLRMRDGRLTFGEKTVSRTITGVNTITAPGSIPGWRAYTADAIIGLDPAAWYPCFNTPRDTNAPHVEEMPEGYMVESMTESPGCVAVRFKGNPAGMDLARELPRAVSGWNMTGGPETLSEGPLADPSGAKFTTSWEGLFAHPPYRPKPGEVFTRFRVAIKEGRQAVFHVDVALNEGAEGKSDGVTFRVTAIAGDIRRVVELHNATTTPAPLMLDLSEFAGKEITLELRATPGPKNDPSCDWARWFKPRVVTTVSGQNEVFVKGLAGWRYAIAGNELITLPPDATDFRAAIKLPDAMFFLKDVPPVAANGQDITALPFEKAFINDIGMPLENPPHAVVERAATPDGKPTLFMPTPNHGCSVADFLCTLPADPVHFKTFATLRTGSQSNGVLYRVQINGMDIANVRLIGGDAPKEIACDLAAWAGESVVLSLITDSAGDNSADWAEWREPRLE